jgi:hypothetical protein
MRSRRELRDEPALWGIWPAVIGVAALGTAVLGASAILLWLGLGRPLLEGGRPVEPAVQLDIVRIALLVTGGLGGLVVLVVAYRRQKVAENAAWLEVLASRQENYKLFNDLYISTSQLLGNESAAVRQAGVYGIARLADDWPRYKDACVDVLCAYLRTPAEAEGTGAERAVRQSAIQLLKRHLQVDGSKSWLDCTVDLVGADFDGQPVEELVWNRRRASGEGSAPADSAVP